MKRDLPELAATALLSPNLNLWRALETRGIDPATMFRIAGCDAAQLHVAGARVPVRVMQRLWTVAEETAGDPALGLDVAAQAQGTTSHALGYAWLASTTLREAMTRLARYVRVLGDLWRARLEEEPSGTRLVVQIGEGGPRFPPSAYDALLGALVRLCRLSYGERFAPIEVTLPRERPADTTRFDAWFRAPIVWHAPRISLVFSREDLAAPLPTANPQIAAASERLAVEYLARLDREDVAMQVKRRLFEALPSGTPSQAEVARALAMSPRTLNRRLAAADTSYAQLLEQTRRELAASYLRRTEYSVSEIAYLLGFAEVSSFNRAFRRWTGAPPSEFRKGPATLAPAG